MNFIEKLQNKSHFVRIQILWISVALVMIIIISFWLIHLKSFLQSSESKQEDPMPSLFGTIKEDFSILQAQAKKIFDNNKKQNLFEVKIIK